MRLPPLATPFAWLLVTPLPRTAPRACVAPRVAAWATTLECLEAFRRETGEKLVPGGFVVPSRAPYPRSRWGDALGKRVGRLSAAARRGALPDERRAALAELGLDLRGAEERSFDKVVSALQTYRRVHGHLDVAASFAVPHDDDAWPRACWGMRLGNRVNAVRSKRQYVDGQPERVAQLDAMGFVWTVPELRFEAFVGGLRAFRHLHGHLNVPQSFRVPEAEPWPRACWRMPLGMRVHQVRSQGQYVSHAKLGAARRRQLEELGFEWRVASGAKPGAPGLRAGRRRRQPRR